MPKLESFYAEVKERTSNPFIVSFIFSWLIINWRIPLGLIWYNIADLQLDGLMSYAQLVSENASLSKMMIYPLIGATTFTLIYPLLRSSVTAFQLFIQSKSSNWHRNITKAGKISVEKYFELRDMYSVSINNLQEVIEKESLYRAKYEEEMNRYVLLYKQTTDLQHRVNEVEVKSNLNYFNGDYWLKFYEEGEAKEKHASIQQGKIYVNTITGDSELMFEILNIAYSPQTTEFITVMRKGRQETEVFPCVLRSTSREYHTFRNFEKNAPIIELVRR